MRVDLAVLYSTLAVIGDSDAALFAIMNFTEIEIGRARSRDQHIVVGVLVDTALLQRAFAFLTHLYAIIGIAVQLAAQEERVALRGDDERGILVTEDIAILKASLTIIVDENSIMLIIADGTMAKNGSGTRGDADRGLAVLEDVAVFDGCLRVIVNDDAV